MTAIGLGMYPVKLKVCDMSTNNELKAAWEFVENTGKSVDEVTAACERDNFMTAEEAKAFGLVDRVLDRH